MYRVILVDDEPWTLAGLHKIFDWHHMGFDVIDKTTDSEYALEVILKEKPDVVFTDIRMPGISGLDLISISRENGLNTEFIIISGHDEFAYAQQAIRLGAFEYCLKPLKKDSNHTLLKRLAAHLKTKKNSSIPLDTDVMSYNVHFNNLLSYIKPHFNQKLQLNDLCEQFYISQSYCSELFRKELGKTFTEYLLSIRMEKAKTFLETTTLSIQEIGQQVGIHDYYHFIKTYKKYYDVTPSKYRKSLRS